MSAKAAMTMPQNSQQNSRNSLRPSLPMYFFNQQAHGFALVLHRGVQGAEVGHGAEEDAAQQHPQQHGQPAEGSGLNGAGHRAGTGNGTELMAEHRPAVGGYIVLAVLMGVGRGFRGGVDAPLVGKPPAIQRVAAQQALYRRDQNDNERVHTILSSLRGVSPAGSNQQNELAARPKPPIKFSSGDGRLPPCLRRAAPAGAAERVKNASPRRAPRFARAGPPAEDEVFKRRRANGPVRRNSASAVPLRLPPFLQAATLLPCPRPPPGPDALPGNGQNGAALLRPHGPFPQAARRGSSSSGPRPPFQRPAALCARGIGRRMCPVQSSCLLHRSDVGSTF